MLDQLRQFSQFVGTKRPLFADEGFAREKMISMIREHVVLVAEKDTQRMGVIAGILVPHFMNPKIRVLAEMFWWVQPEHRQTRAGLLLLKEFIRYGKEAADWITFALEHNSPVRDETLLRHGFSPLERNFILEVS